MLSSRSCISYYVRTLAEKYISMGFEANSNISKKRAIMMLSKRELSELTENSTNKHNMINWYYKDVIHKLCFGLFLKRHQLEQRETESNS